MCGKEDCPIYKTCSRIPYLNTLTGEVECGVYKNHLYSLEYKKKCVSERLYIKLKQFCSQYNPSFYMVYLHIAKEDYQYIITSPYYECIGDEKIETFMGYPLYIDETTFIEVSSKIDV